MNEDELNERLMAELNEVLFPDKAKQQMQVEVAKSEMLEFIDGLSDAQLNVVTRMMGMRKGQDKDTWFSGVQQFAGMLYHEEMQRNRANQFAEVPSA